MLIDRVYNSVYRRCKQIRSKKKKEICQKTVFFDFMILSIQEV